MIFAHYLFIVSLFFQFTINIQDANAEKTIQVCGKALRELLALVCDSQYYGPNNGKRYLGGTYRNDFLERLDDAEELSDLSDSDVPHYRIAKGVVNECCYKPCTRATLEMYCL